MKRPNKHIETLKKLAYHLNWLETNDWDTNFGDLQETKFFKTLQIYIC